MIGSNAGLANVAEQSLRIGRRTALGLLCGAVLALAGCANLSTPKSQPSGTLSLPSDPTPQVAQPQPLPPTSVGSPARVGIILPLTHQSPEVVEIGTALMNAAQLALFEVGGGRIVLIPKDDKGDPAAAEQAAAELVQEGAEIIIGPLFASSVQSAGAVARSAGVPMIAFSTDKAAAGNGVYLLSFQPEEEVRRIVRFAVKQGRTRLAAMIPETPYGQVVQSALQDVVTTQGAVLQSIQTYPRSRDTSEITAELSGPARVIAEYDRRKEGSKKKGLGAAAAAGAAASSPVGDDRPATQVSYDAILLPESGTHVKALASLLAYYDVDPRQTKFLGTGLWDETGIGKEPSLVGGWFAAPAPELRQAFAARFEAAHQKAPPRIASLAFDAVALAASLAADSAPGQRYTQTMLTSPDGFSGVDGIFRFRPDGTAERGLAVMQVQPYGVEVVSPAPQSFQEVDRTAQAGGY